MRKILLKLSFNGKNYCGWQTQKNGPSVQAAVENALGRFLKDSPSLAGCGRTDSGVHALRYYAAFATESHMSCENIVKALNALLPYDISARGAYSAPLSFHPRFDAVQKEYEYLLYTNKTRDPFYEGLALHYPHDFDAPALNRAAQAFVGRHDFAGFCASKSAVKNTVRTIYSFSVRRDERDFALVRITVKGDGFLHNMVRILTGTVLYAAQGKICPGGLPDVLASRDRTKAGPTAPAHGLYLREVWYPDVIR